MVFSSLIFLYAFFSLSLLAYGLCRSQKQQNTVLLLIGNTKKIQTAKTLRIMKKPN